MVELSLLSSRNNIIFEMLGKIPSHILQVSYLPIVCVCVRERDRLVLGKPLGGTGHAVGFLPMPSPRARQDPQLFPDLW